MFLQVSAGTPQVDVLRNVTLWYDALIIFFLCVVHLDKQSKIFPENKKFNYLYYDLVWVTAGLRIESVIRSLQAYLK